jgi:hypothetical protein
MPGCGLLTPFGLGVEVDQLSRTSALRFRRCRERERGGDAQPIGKGCLARVVRALTHPPGIACELQT